jgi:hypothetical protein
MRRFAVVLLAAGLIVWLAAPALSSHPFVPRAVEFEQALGTSAWSRDAGGHGWRSPVVRAPRRFDLVGLRWRAGGDPGITRIRVRDVRRGWQAWTRMADDHAGGAGAEPVWAGGADAYQLRTDARPGALRARFVNATGSATATARLMTALRRGAHGVLAALAGSPAHAQVPAPGSRPAPPIIPREQWGADQCRPTVDPSYGEVKLGFVHHTVNANSYSRAQSAAIILSICRYHRNTKGWHDIGYNFLVDRYGQIFEGRAGGIDQPVVGAQAQGYNGVSTSVANIGTFAQAAPTAAGVRATAELLAWKLSLHGAPVTGSVEVTSAGGPMNRHPDGSRVTFARIASHRDADRTSCPGDALFAQLPEIRAQAAALAPQYVFLPPPGAVTLQAADTTLDYPQPAEVSGRVTAADGRALADVPVALQYAGAFGFFAAGQTWTDPDGEWVTQLQTQSSRSVRAMAQLPGGARVTSATVALQVAPRLTLSAPAEVGAGRRFTVRGAMSPLRRARVTLLIAREGSDAQMHNIARAPVRLKGGRFAVALRLRRAALHRLRVAFAGDGRNGAASSADVLVRAVR